MLGQLSVLSIRSFKVTFPPLKHLPSCWCSFSWEAVEKLFISARVIRSLFEFQHYSIRSQSYQSVKSSFRQFDATSRTVGTDSFCVQNLTALIKNNYPYFSLNYHKQLKAIHLGWTLMAVGANVGVRLKDIDEALNFF